MPDTRTAVARRNEAVTTLMGFVEQMKPQIARALPMHLNGDRMTRLALTAVRQNPALAETTQLSFAGSLLTAAALGLEPNTPTAEAYLVPYRDECTLIVGYQGWVKLWWQHPLAASLVAESVYPEDDFRYSLGTGGGLWHTPNKHLRAPDSQPIYYYAHGKLTTGAEAFVVLTPEEVKALRQGKEGPDPRFKGGDPQRWMERKTCIRQLIKLLPKTPVLALAAQADEADGTELYKAREAERVEGTEAPSRTAITEGGEAVDTGTGQVVEGGVVEDPPAGGEGL